MIWELPSDKGFITPENTWIAILVFWSSIFLKYPLIWQWWLSKEIQGAIKDVIAHQNCFSVGALSLKDDLGEESFSFSFRTKIIISVAIWMCLNANQKICNTHLLRKQNHYLGLGESNYFRLPPLLPRSFPWARWRWGITSDEIQDCRSIHHGIKICSGKCSSCIFNILHFLLS